MKLYPLFYFCLPIAKYIILHIDAIKNNISSLFVSTSTDASPYIINDIKAEKQIDFNLSKSLIKARQKGPVLKGWKVHIKKGVKPMRIKGNEGRRLLF